jgi:A/G-specific adenine glycosylase
MFHPFPAGQAEEFASRLFAWFKASMRPLPWRIRYDPYDVWISEIMLQQTQMERGVSFFLRWKDRFPCVESVASAPEEEILRYWEGLGYYRRARLLHAAAKLIVDRHGGRIPDDRDELLALPGLGDYTANAILSIAYGQDIAVADANVERVFSRLLDIDAPVKDAPARSFIRQEAQRLLPCGNARIYNQSLMELGALICKKHALCGQCPVQGWCLANQRGTVKVRPVQGTRSAIENVVSAHALIIYGNSILVHKRDDAGSWGGMWEFPGIICHGPDIMGELADFLEHLGLSMVPLQYAGHITHNYTNHRLTAHFFRCEAGHSCFPHMEGMPPERQRLIPCAELGSLAMPAHHRKIAERLFNQTARRNAG